MTTSYLDRGEGRVAYEVTGQGPLVVCVPGMGDLRLAYRSLAPELVGAGFRVAVMDLRGHGDSDDGFADYDSVSSGRDLLALIRHLGGGPAVVVSHSMTGGSSVWAAVEDPALVSGLALISPITRNLPVNPVLAGLSRVLLVKPWGPAAWRMYYRSLYKSQRPADLDQHVGAIRESLRRGDHWRSFVRTTRTRQAAAEARLGQVRVPALVVIGSKDPDFPDPTAEAQLLGVTLNAEVMIVPEAGHYPMLEYPSIVDPAVVALARRVQARA